MERKKTVHAYLKGNIYPTSHQVRFDIRYLGGERGARIEINVRWPQKMLNLVRFPILGEPQAPNNELNPIKQVLPSTSPIVNVIAWLEFELTNLDVTIQHINLYTTETHLFQSIIMASSLENRTLFKSSILTECRILLTFC